MKLTLYGIYEVAGDELTEYSRPFRVVRAFRGRFVDFREKEQCE